MQSTITGKLSRRDFLRAGAGFTGVMVLAACAPGAAPGAAPAGSEGAAPSTEPVTITFAGWGETAEVDGVNAAIKQFESEQGQVKVVFLHTPNITTEYQDKMLTDIAAGTPPDTAFIASPLYRTLIRDNVLLDITDALKADPLLGAPDYFIEPQEEQRCTADGKWYGIGSCWVAPHLYYNADLLAEEGIEPPSNDPANAWTWQQFLDAATALTVDAAGKHPNESGFDPDNIQRWGVSWPAITQWYNLHSAIVANGGDWIDLNTGQCILDQPEATEAIQNVADLSLKHHVAPASAATQALGMSDAQMLENGRIAMAVDGSWALSWLHAIKPTLGTGVLPGMSQKTGTDMQAHFHSAFAATKSPDAAWQWVRYLATPYYQTQFCKIGLWLPSQTALMTPEGLQEWITPGIHPEGYVDIATKYLPQYGHTMYMPPGWAESMQLLQPGIDKVFNGDATAEQAMAEVVPAANEVLKPAS